MRLGKRNGAQNGRQTRIARAAKDALPNASHPAVARLAVALQESKQATEQQAATAEILRAMSRSTRDAQPVFDAIVRNAHRLCGALYTVLHGYDGKVMTLLAAKHVDTKAIRVLRDTYPEPAKPDKYVGRAILDRRTVHSADVPNDRRFPGNRNKYSKVWPRRAGVAVPLIRDGIVVGAIACGRLEPKPFSKKEIALLQTFADQAAIAMENVRLFKETSETLERQTATAEILKVIARSPSDVQPVFDTIVRSAVQLCGALFGSVYRFDGERMHFAAHHNWPRRALAFLKGRYPRVPDREQAAGRAILTRSVAQIEDVLSDPDYRRTVGRRGGWRRVLAVPMMREGVPVGTISVAWADPGPIPDSQVELLKTFADQAVIAIENTRLFNETKEALEHQKTSADILKIVASSVADTEPVFTAITEAGSRLVPGCRFALQLARDGHLHYTSHSGVDGVPRAKMARFFPIPVKGGPTPATKAIDEKRVVHVADIEQAGKQLALGKQLAKAAGWRAIVAVPLMRGSDAIGTITITRREPGSFSEKQIALLQTFAGQAVIALENAKMFREVQDRNAELKQALDFQGASAEILSSISSSITDAQPVFDAIVTSLLRLFGTRFATVALLRNGELHLAALRGEKGYEWLKTTYPQPPKDWNLTGRAVLSGKVQQVTPCIGNPATPPRTAEVAAKVGFDSIIAAPMLREGKVVGAITTGHRDPVPFDDKQVALIKAFADQAVIAIENARLFNETKEALEQQTATAEILRVISSSPTDIQPVLDAVASTAARLCGASDAVIRRVDGDILRLVAKHGAIPADGEDRPIDRGSASGRAVVERRTIHIWDVMDDAELTFTREMARRHGFRTVLSTPLLREGQAIGTISIRRPEARPFSDSEVKLLKTFADQAVIAIENVRLFNETKEALERQTATSEILKVIASSPSDVQPVFDAIAASARRLLAGGAALVARRAGDKLELVAYTSSGEAADAALRKLFPAPITGQGHLGKAILSAAPVGTSDIQNDETYSEAFREIQRTRGVRSIVSVPMLRDGEPIGVISVNRPVAGKFSEHQTNLLKTFADQAVIAIENVRLFNETKEALEQQTATSEVLNVLSRSTLDATPVFQAVVDKAVALCGADNASILQRDGDVYRYVANAGRFADQESFMSYWGTITLRPGRGSLTGRVALERRSVQIEDIDADPEYERDYAAHKVSGSKAHLGVPLLKDGEPVGLIIARRFDARRFADKQVRLLETFAAQAVIAIENVRLFKELQERTEALTKSVSQLTALGEVGQAISSTLDLEKVLKTIVSHAVQLTGLDVGAIYEYDERAEEFHLRAAENMNEENIELLRQRPIKRGDGAVGGTAVTREPVQVADIQDESYKGRFREMLLRSGRRSLLAVPLMREDHIIGALAVQRNTPGPFAPEVVELLKTFATQSAMAIQNARLFREIAEKGRQLEVASRHKSDFLASMSHELRTPLNALLGFNEMLLGDVYGEVPGDMRPPLAQMQSSGKHLLRLINNVLDLAKIESGRMELALAEYSVHDTVEGVRSTLQPLAAEKGLDFRAAVPPEIPLAYGDPGRIAQCLMNLAGNSLKFTKAGKVEISVAVDNGLLRYRVADTGIGIPPDKIDGLFTEFKQTDATVASEYGGTGLGLSISKKFVEMHGGRIWAESEPGRGSVFTFEVPLRAKTP